MNFHGDQWISNGIINHLIRETNQLWQKDWLCSWTSRFTLLTKTHFHDSLASGGAGRCQWRYVFHFLSQRSESFNLKDRCKPIIFTNYKTQRCFFKLLLYPDSPPTLGQSHGRTLAGGLDSYNRSRFSSELLTSGSSALQIVAFETGNQSCRSVERAPSLHQRLFGAHSRCAGCWMQVKIRPDRK